MQENTREITAREELEAMYREVDNDENVTYILFVSKSVGAIKCSNLNIVNLKLLENTESGPQEAAYQYRFTEPTLEKVSSVLQQANIVNTNNPTKKFKLLSHELYYGEIEMLKPKTQIIFKDTFCILTDVEIMGDKYKHFIVKYNDFEYLMTQ